MLDGLVRDLLYSTLTLWKWLARIFIGVLVMGDIAHLDSELYEQYVRDCLAHLYDYTFLQDHPLPRLLIPNAPGNASRVQVFRDIVTEAIESLRPGDLSDSQTKDSRIYNILVL